jgi:hypothetical protein
MRRKLVGGTSKLRMHGCCVHLNFFSRAKAGGTRTKRTNTSADCSTGRRRRQRRRWPMATISCVMILVQTETVRAAAFLCGCSLDASGGNFSSLVYVAHETSTLNGSLHLRAKAHKRTIIQKHLPLPLSLAHTHIIRIIRSVCLFSEKQPHKICLLATSFATSAELQVRFVCVVCSASTAGPPKLLLPFPLLLQKEKRRTSLSHTDQEEDPSCLLLPPSFIQRRIGLGKGL